MHGIHSAMLVSVLSRLTKKVYLVSELPTAQRLHVCNTDIRQDAEGRYCVNDLHNAAGNGNGERPSMWLKIKQTMALVDELENGAGITALSSQARGSKQGTYVCRELVYAYAMEGAWKLLRPTKGLM